MTAQKSAAFSTGKPAATEDPRLTNLADPEEGGEGSGQNKGSEIRGGVKRTTSREGLRIHSEKVRAVSHEQGDSISFDRRVQ